jgi:hypothetical protein
LHLRLSQALAQGEARQAVDQQMPRFVATLLSADDDESMVRFKAGRTALPHFPLVDLHRSGRCATLDMAFSRASRSSGRG